MNELLMRILSTSLLLLLGIAAYIFFIRTDKKRGREEKKEDREETAADFTNVVTIDAENSILYSADGHIFSYIEIQPISLELLAEDEQKTLADNITLALSKYDEPWKIISISRPVDVKLLIDQYENMANKAEDNVRKKLLRESIRMLENYALSEEVTQRQFFFVIWGKYTDKKSEAKFLQKRKIFLSDLSDAKLKVRLINKPNIIRLLNLYFNPSSIYYET